MKIAVPEFYGRVAPRFGAARFFWVALIEDGKLKDSDLVNIEKKSPLEKAKYIKDQRIDTLICLGIEIMLYNYLTGFGIRVIPGIIGDLQQVVDSFINGRLVQKPPPYLGMPLNVWRGRFRRGKGPHRHRPF